MVVRLDDRVEESPLPESAAPAMAEIERARIDAVQPLESRAQRQLSKFENEVVVGRQQRVPEDTPIAPYRLTPEQRQKRPAVRVITEELRSIDRLAVDVIDRADLLNPRRSHSARMPAVTIGVEAAGREVALLSRARLCSVCQTRV
jgi:hypothetical protein